MTTQIHEIDAAGKKLGRVATQAAVVLMGKNSPDFVRHAQADVRVHIKNASKLHLPEKKQKQKIYLSFSGYPGGLKKKTMETLAARHGYRDVVRKAVYGMLPVNKLRAVAMKRLIIED